MAGTPAPQPNPAPNGAAPVPAATPVAAPAAESWYSGFKDSELKAYLDLNRVPDAETAVKNWREAERFVGAPKDELIRIAKDPSKLTEEQRNQVYARLGRPEKIEDYGADLNNPLAAKAIPLLHKYGMPKEGVAELAGIIQQIGEQEAAAKEQARNIEFDRMEEQLHNEWPGEIYNQRTEMGIRAMRELVSPMFGGDLDKTSDMIGKMEDAIGSAQLVKLFAHLGQKIMEGSNGAESFVTGSNPSNFGMTPEQAKARIDQLNHDKEWGARMLNNPGGPEKAEWSRLIELASRAR